MKCNTKENAREVAEAVFQRYLGPVKLEDCDVHLFPTNAEGTDWEWTCYFRWMTLSYLAAKECFQATTEIQGKVYLVEDFDLDKVVSTLYIQVVEDMDFPRGGELWTETAVFGQQVCLHLIAALECAKMETLWVGQERKRA